MLKTNIAGPQFCISFLALGRTTSTWMPSRWILCVSLVLLQLLVPSESQSGVVGTDRTQSALPSSFLSYISSPSSANTTIMPFPVLTMLDFNNDGCEDIFFSDRLFPNQTGSVNRIMLLSSSCNGTFTDQTQLLFAAVGGNTSLGQRSGGHVWADFDNNLVNDLLLISDTTVSILFGAVDSLTGGLSYTSNQSFVSQIVPILKTPLWADIGVSDLNGDNRKDLLIVTSQRELELYQNDPSGFVPAGNLGPCLLPNTPRILLFDWNNDKLDDILVLGPCQQSNQFWQNNGNFTLTVKSSLLPADLLSLGWGCAVAFDYNNDSYLDLFVAGDNNGVNRFSRLLRNNAGINFTDVTDTAFPNGTLVPRTDCGVDVADIDGDGYSDLLFAGQIDTLAPLTTLFRNDPQASQFIDVTSNVLPNVNPANAAAVRFGSAARDKERIALIFGMDYTRWTAQLYTFPLPRVLVTQISQIGPIILTNGSIVAFLRNSSTVITLLSGPLLDITISNTSAPLRSTGCLELDGSIQLRINQGTFPSKPTSYLLVSSPCISGAFTNVSVVILNADGQTAKCVIDVKQDLTASSKTGFAVLLNPNEEQLACHTRASKKHSSSTTIIIISVVCGIALLALLITAIIYFCCYRNPNRPDFARRWFRSDARTRKRTY